MMQGVILAGGYGKRLMPITATIPKSMVEIAGRPIIEWEMLWMRHFGVRSFLILAGYRKEKLIEYTTALAKRLSVEVDFSIEKEPLGTAGALKNAAGQIDGDEFYVTNGDHVIDIDIGRLRLEKELACIALKPLTVHGGVVKMDDRMITEFVESPLLKEVYINAGVYLLKHELLERLPEKGDIEKTVFPELAKQRLISAVKYETGYFRDVTTIKDIDEMSREVTAREIYERMSK
jgi:NDP-sugar pyrophosphorylase family protein